MEFNLKIQSFLGIMVFILIAWLFSERKKFIKPKIISLTIITQVFWQAWDIYGIQTTSNLKLRTRIQI